MVDVGEEVDLVGTCQGSCSPVASLLILTAEWSTVKTGVELFTLPQFQQSETKDRIGQAMWVFYSQCTPVEFIEDRCDVLQGQSRYILVYHTLVLTQSGIGWDGLYLDESHLLWVRVCRQMQVLDDVSRSTHLLNGDRRYVRDVCQRFNKISQSQRVRILFRGLYTQKLLRYQFPERKKYIKFSM